MKVIIAGSREFNNYELMKKHTDNFNRYHQITEVVSGTARGADQLGERWATEHNVPITKMPADWNTFGKSAGYKRNEQMANYADALIAFDLGTRGTMHMINLAKEKKLKCYIVRIKSV